MADTKTMPDLIALQEVVGQSGDAQPYDTLSEIISQIRSKTHVSYRIAYLSVSPTPQGLRPTLWAGRALLYNPARMINTTSPAPSNDESIIATHPRKSLPCSNQMPIFRDFCTSLEGYGISWISSARRSDGRWLAGPAYARIQLKGAVDLSICSVHVAYENDLPDNYLKQFNQLLANAESRLGARRLYPPVVLGDFNLGRSDVLAHFKIYDIAGYAKREVIGVLMGNFATFPASQKQAYFTEAVLAVDA